MARSYRSWLKEKAHRLSLETPALRIVYRYASPTVGPVVEVQSLRRPEFAFRKTTYRRVIVHEALLTRAFPLIQDKTRFLVLLLLEGSLTLEIGKRSHRVEPGEAWLLGASMLGAARFEDASFLDLEWTAAHETSGHVPRKLETPDPASVRRVAEGIATANASQARVLDDTFELLRSMRAPIELTTTTLTGGPSTRDLRIARAMEKQLASLATEGTALHLSGEAGLSSRQLQRVVADFNRRYGLNAGNWRDTRNRWRLQVAAVLLSRPELPIEMIAREVGYRSGTSLARAFAIAGFPEPAVLREKLLEPNP